jgi:hypothetical protein
MVQNVTWYGYCVFREERGQKDHDLKGKMETELTYLVIFVAFMLGLLWLSLPKKRSPQQPRYER